MRDALFADMAKWLRQERWTDIDSLRCTFRWSPYHRVKAAHDAYRQFVEGDMIPHNKFAEAKQYAAQVGIQLGRSLPGLETTSDADEDACCRVIARGGIITGGYRRC
jgi:hypothetical protein